MHAFMFSGHIFGAMVLVMLILVLQFFRNPKRTTPKNEKHLIAPVDGKVVIVEEVFEKEYFKDKRLQISIFIFFPINIQFSYFFVLLIFNSALH